MKQMNERSSVGIKMADNSENHDKNYSKSLTAFFELHIENLHFIQSPFQLIFCT